MLTNILLGIAFLAFVTSIWVNVFLLKWRRSVSTSDVSIVPSELLATLEKQTKALDGNSSQQTKVLKEIKTELSSIFGALANRIGEAQQSSGQLLEAFTNLHDALNAKDKEIERLKSGYDAEIFRRFLVRFLRVEKALSEEIEDAGNEDSELLQILKEIQVLLSDAFLDCGLERFSPDVGASVRDTDGLDEHYDTVDATDGVEPLTIAQVIKGGWRIRTAAGFDYVRKARVAVFVQPAMAEEAE